MLESLFKFFYFIYDVSNIVTRKTFFGVTASVENKRVFNDDVLNDDDDDDDDLIMKIHVQLTPMEKNNSACYYCRTRN